MIPPPPIPKCCLNKFTEKVVLPEPVVPTANMWRKAISKSIMIGYCSCSGVSFFTIAGLGISLMLLTASPRCKKYFFFLGFFSFIIPIFAWSPYTGSYTFFMNQRINHTKENSENKTKKFIPIAANTR